MLKKATSKIYSFIILLVGIFSTNTTEAQMTHKKVVVQIEANEDCVLDTMRLFAWTGIQVEPYAAVGLSKKKSNLSFDFKLQNVKEGSYYVGTDFKNMQPLLLGDETKVVIEAKNCADASTFNFKKSDLNKDFRKLLDSIKVQSNVFFSLVSSYQQNIKKPDVLKELDTKMAAVDFRRKMMLNKLKKDQPFLGKIAALYTYLSYQNNKVEGQQEGEYLASNYFQFVNMKDESYVRLPFFYEAVKNYSTNLTRVGLNATDMTRHFNKLLEDIGKDKLHHQSALLAITFGLVSSKSHTKLFLDYVRYYQRLYNGQNKVLDKFLKDQVIKIRGIAPVGEEAPDFTATTPDGKKLSLKDLRGKVLLVDFWASWCGPCRRENPNVVRVYNKYKSRGFDILGVSLDKNKDRWLGAIQKDQLTWNHVSDLRGWASAPAKLYGVSGIPFTLLLDKEGKVIAKNLRGAALENKLREIFGD